MDAILVRSLHKSLPDNEGADTLVLDDVTFSVADHQILSLFGPNGCGKTTLLNICANLRRKDSGIVQIFGSPPHATRIGYIPQSFAESLFPWLTNLDNVAYPLRLSGASKREARRQAESFLDELDIRIPLRSYPYESSGGQRQLTALARALTGEPAVLLADEPFSALDFSTRIEMQDKFLDIVASKLRLPTIFVSHQIEDAIYLGDKVIVLSRQPARIVDSFDVTLPRPRKQDMKKTEEFRELGARAIDAFLRGSEV